MGNTNGSQEDNNDIVITRHDSSDSIGDEVDLEFTEGQSIRFEVGLDSGNLDNTLFIRHQGATINFGSNLRHQEKSRILLKIQTDTLRAINMRGNEDDSLRLGVEETQDQIE